MTKSTCELVAERVALGEPLGDVAEHAASCARCRQLAALPVELGAIHRDADPGLGFTARMTAGAQQRVVARRRRRVATGLAAAVAVTSLGVFALTRNPGAPAVATAPAASEHVAADHVHPVANPVHDPWNPDDRHVDRDVQTLVHLADLRRSSRLSANWARIEKPLAPYRALLEGTTP